MIIKKIRMSKVIIMPGVKIESRNANSNNIIIIIFFYFYNNNNNNNNNNNQTMYNNLCVAIIRLVLSVFYMLLRIASLSLNVKKKSCKC